MQQQHTTDARTASIPLSSALLDRIVQRVEAAGRRGDAVAKDRLSATRYLAGRSMEAATDAEATEELACLDALVCEAREHVVEQGRVLLDQNRLALELLCLRQVATLERELLVS